MASPPQQNPDDAVKIIKDSCMAKWKELQKLHMELQKKRTIPVISNKDSASVDVQRAKVSLLVAQLELVSNASVVPLPSNPDILLYLLSNELSKSVCELEDTVSLIQTQLQETIAELKQEKFVHDEHVKIKEVLVEKLHALELQTAEQDVDEPTIVKETKQKYQNMRKYSMSLMENMLEFVQKQFPVPTAAETANWLKKKQGLRVNNVNNVQPFQSLQSILEDLMNQCMLTPHDPYIQLSPITHWQPYVQLLLRCGIAIRHPDDDSKIKLTPFHW